MFASVQLLSWVVAIFIWGAGISRNTRTGRWGKQLTLALFSAWLWICQFLVYILQMVLDSPRPDVFCPSVTSYGFPSLAAMYVAAGVTFVVGFAVWRKLALPWSVWPVLAVLFVCPFVLAWFTFNTWVEVMLSILIGVGSTLAFFLVLDRVLLNQYPYMLNQAPWTWINADDTWLMDEHQYRREAYLRELMK